MHTQVCYMNTRFRVVDDAYEGEYYISNYIGNYKTVCKIFADLFPWRSKLLEQVIY